MEVESKSNIKGLKEGACIDNMVIQYTFPQRTLISEKGCFKTVSTCFEFSNDINLELITINVIIFRSVFRSIKHETCILLPESIYPVCRQKEFVKNYLKQLFGHQRQIQTPLPFE